MVAITEKTNLFITGSNFEDYEKKNESILSWIYSFHHSDHMNA